MHNGQMELSLQNGNSRRLQRGRRPSRAQWWFQKMRQAVDRACGYPLPCPPPEQMVFPGTHREPMAPAANTGSLARSRRLREERQVVE